MTSPNGHYTEEGTRLGPTTPCIEPARGEGIPRFIAYSPMMDRARPTALHCGENSRIFRDAADQTLPVTKFS
jgi:hypothetical protein